MSGSFRERIVRMTLWGAGVGAAAFLLRALGILHKLSPAEPPLKGPFPSPTRVQLAQDVSAGIWRDGWSN